MKGDVLVDLVVIFLVAVGLAMDAFAVSISRGISTKNLNIDGLKMAMSFGLFQALMPVLGWLAGLGLRDLISSFDHWIAFGLLCFVGCKMVYESRKTGMGNNESSQLRFQTLLVLSIATSIDALTVGLSFAFLEVSIGIPIIVMGVVTFLLSFLGVSLGSRLGRFFGNKIEIVGGLILIGIGVRILAEHLA
ncbi:manganese efflux pump MntP family protein [Candidatus Bathyarchaeota archaeon]|nr:manganese efflux pump MntP family protein [Candidatus Bathyarchaeota archaeon]